MGKLIQIFQILSLVFLSVLFSCSNKNCEIEFIQLKIEHSRRYPYSEVTIEITNRNKGHFVHLRSLPENNDPKWAYSRIDTCFAIDNKAYSTISKSVNHLKGNDFSKAEMDGMDGTTCSLKFVLKEKTYNFSYWSPDYEMESRGLIEYVHLVKELIEIANLKPAEIL